MSHIGLACIRTGSRPVLVLTPAFAFVSAIVALSSAASSAPTSLNWHLHLAPRFSVSSVAALLPLHRLRPNHAAENHLPVCYFLNSSAASSFPFRHLHRHPSTRMQRPDIARPLTSGSRAPFAAYPYESAYQSPAYTMHHAVYPRQHHSFYDDRGPPPPPPHHYPLPINNGQRLHERSAHDMPVPRRTSSNNCFAEANLQPLTTYHGHIKTTKDAILLLAACDLPDDAGRSGHAPPRRMKRRLLDSERPGVICSGSIFVWEEKEAGMRRWTDGKCWSASRVSGCFLTYRELEARKKPSASITGGPTSNLYKTDGLIKQSFSMTTTSGRKLHVISYYTKSDVREGRLRRVGEDQRFVGEAGGEWGLFVDEHEFPDPISRAGDLPSDMPSGQVDTSQSPPSSPLALPARNLRQGWASGADSSTASSSPKTAEDVPREFGADHRPNIAAPFYETRPFTTLSKYEGHRPVRVVSSDWPSYPEPSRSNHGKRAFDETKPVNSESRVTRPQLKRLRSSSMNSGLPSPYLAPVRVLERAGSADEGVSNLRSTRGGTPSVRERDSAVGALLSLRSSIGSIGDESSPSLASVKTMFTRSPSASTPGSLDPEPVSLAKPAFSCTDRAALDRFSIRI